MPEEADDDFVYEALPGPSYIRLLDRLPPAEDGTLRFRIVTDDLDDKKLAYLCLSYTWGNPFAHGNEFREAYDAAEPKYAATSLVKVLVNDRPLHIQQNLHDAMATLPDDTFRQFVSRPLDNTKGHRYLHRAAARGDGNLLKIWLARGTDIEVTDDEGYTAMHYAAGNNQLEMARLLISYGADINAKTDAGKTPLDFAKEGGFEDVASLLEGHEAVEKQEIELELVRPYIWADAICINQKDMNEKSVQVSMMDRIYTKASYVLAWLGLPDALSDRGLATLDTLAKHKAAFDNSEIIPFGGKSSEKYDAVGMPHLNTDDWNALASIFQRQWFRRSWIIQEAVLNDGLLVYLGSKSIQWRHLGTIADAIRYQEAKLGTTLSTRFAPHNDVGVSVAWNMAEVSKFRRQKALSIHPEKLEECRNFFNLTTMLHNCWTFLATDPRDKIFACYGLLNAFSETRSLADYNLTIPQVYTVAARNLIKQEGNLSLLAYCVFPLHRRKDLPSWVPDFGLPGVNAVPDSYTASKNLTYTPPEIPSIPHNPELRIQGVFLGNVSQVAGRAGVDGLEKLAFDRSWLTFALALREKKAYGDDMVISFILWTVLCMGKSFGNIFDSREYGTEAPDMLGMEFRYFLNLLILAEADSKIREHIGKPKRSTSREMWFDVSMYDPMVEDPEMLAILDDLDAMAEFDSAGGWTPTRQEVLDNWNNYVYNVLRVVEVDLENPPTDIHLPQGIFQDSSRAIGNGYVLPTSLVAQKLQGFISVYGNLYGGRQLMMFNENRFLGLGSIAAKPGDELWLLAGLHAPAILRPRPRDADNEGPRKFEFFGASYIYGLMEGKIDIKNKLQDIILV